MDILKALDKKKIIIFLAVAVAVLLVAIGVLIFKGDSEEINPKDDLTTRTTQTPVTKEESTTMKESTTVTTTVPTTQTTTKVTTTKPATTKPSKKEYTASEILAFTREKAGIWVNVNDYQKYEDGQCSFRFLQISEGLLADGSYPGSGSCGEVIKIVEEKGTYTINLRYAATEEYGDFIPERYLELVVSFGNGRLLVQNYNQTYVYAGADLQAAINYVLAL